MKKKNLLMTAIAIFGLATITRAQVPSYVPTNGLIGYWPFNGNATDASGNGNNGTVNGASLTSDRFGNSNAAQSFSPNNYIEVLDGAQFDFAIQNQMSISFWMKATSANNPSTSVHIPISKQTGIGVSQLGWNTYIEDSGNQLGMVVKNGTTGTQGYYGASNLGYLDGNWHLFSSTFNNVLCSIYIDNVLVNTSTTSGVIIGDNDGNVRFGQVEWASIYSFYGQLDDIGIWNRALTICEIQDLYASQLNSTYVNAGTDQTICNGDPVTLSAINSLNYSWDNGVTDGVAFNPTTTQDYTVSADSAGCLSTDVVTVTVNENTTATQIQTALDSYTWSINSQTYTQSGTYTAIIPNAAGCDSTITLDLSLDFTGTIEFSEDNLFTVFPNPAQSAINIKADNKLIGDVYSIYDNTGRVVLTGKLNSKDTTIELNNLSGGIYMFSVGENMKQTFKVIKE
jgi:hypothetical protein